MLTKKLTYPLLFVCLLACYASPASVLAQSDSLLLRDYRFVSQQDVWLTMPNAAALTRFSAPDIAEAEVSLSTAHGGLVDYYQSRHVLQADVRAEAFHRLNSRTVVAGGISYDNFSGRDMTGSVFISPSRLPFNIVDDSLTNAGRKHRDTYRLYGAVGYDLWQGIAIGARLDYTAANYAKYKDLRHKNKLMDLSLSAGVYAPLLPWLSAGANYTYHRQTESVDFATYGKSEKVYKSLIDYGTWLGKVEQFGSEGYTDKSHEMPLFEDSHGADFQLEVRPVQQLAVVGTVGFSRGDGYYGRKSPYTITYTRHRRDVLHTALSLSHQLSRTSRHRLDFSYQSEQLANKAETFRELTNESSATYYEYYDATETGDKRWDDFALCYTLLTGIRGELPAWQLQAACNYGERRQASYLFPYYRHQHLKQTTVDVQATRHLVGPKGVWSLSLAAGYQQGSGNPFSDYTFVTPSALQEAPATMEAWLWREYQYLVARQYHVGAGGKYAFLLPTLHIKPYARLRIDYRKATESFPYSTGTSRLQLALAVGCNF